MAHRNRAATEWMEEGKDEGVHREERERERVARHNDSTLSNDILTVCVTSIVRVTTSLFPVWSLNWSLTCRCKAPFKTKR